MSQPPYPLSASACDCGRNFGSRPGGVIAQSSGRIEPILLVGPVLRAILHQPTGSPDVKQRGVGIARKSLYQPQGTRSPQRRVFHPIALLIARVAGPLLRLDRRHGTARHGTLPYRLRRGQAKVFANAKTLRGRAARPRGDDFAAVRAARFSPTRPNRRYQLNQPCAVQRHPQLRREARERDCPVQTEMVQWRSSARRKRALADLVACLRQIML